MNLKILRFWPGAAALLSGVLLALCYPTWNFSSLIWFWALPLLAALWFSTPEKKRMEVPAAELGAAGGLAISAAWCFF